MELVNSVLNFLTLPLAIYGGWTLLGLPGTDAITALGRKTGAKLIAWVRAKAQ